MGMNRLADAVNKLATPGKPPDPDERAKKILELVQAKAAASNPNYFNLKDAATVAQSVGYAQPDQDRLFDALRTGAAEEAASSTGPTLEAINSIIGETEIEASSPAVLPDWVRTLAALLLLGFAGAAGGVAVLGSSTNIDNQLVVAAIVCVVASVMAFMGWGTLKIRRGGEKAAAS